ncbi:hypothetical protein MRX96_033114 [Rhipicephalus microplus]
MDEQTESEDSDPAALELSEWTPIIRAYKGKQPSPQTQVLPSHSFSVSAKPNARVLSALQPTLPLCLSSRAAALSKNNCVCHRRSRYEVNNFLLLPSGIIKVVFRPRGGLALNGAMAQPLMQGLQVTAAGRDLGELHLRIQPTNNTFTVATCHERTTLHLVQLKELVLRKTSYPVATYRTPPPAAVRGFLSQAYW